MSEEAPQEEMIPKSVMLKRINQKNAHIEKLDASHQELADALAAASAFESEAKMAGELRSLLEARSQEFATYKENTMTRESLYRRGILSQDDQELVLWKYNRLEADNRPELGTWLEEGAKSDPHLTSVFRPPQSEGDVAPQSPRPAPNNGTAQPPSAGQTLTWEVIQKMPLEERLSRNAEIKQILGYK